METTNSTSNHISGQPLTTDIAKAVAPDLLRNAIDRAIVKIRPMGTPIDQISRLGHVRSADALEVDYYSVDTRGDSIGVIRWGDITTDDDGISSTTVTVSTTDDFEPSETVYIRGTGGETFTGYIVSKGTDQLVLKGNFPADKSLFEDKLIRMGRAATQLDVQSPQYSVLPKKRTNYCQIFKMQIEQSMVMKMSHKEIGWDFTDQQEAAIYDMRVGMEKQFLFGEKMKLYDNVKGETVTLTQGIWTQAGKEIELQLNDFGSSELVDFLRQVFTGNCGSRKKILVGGSELIAALNKVENTKVITALDQETMWGIDFTALQSKFGRLYVLYSEIFDVMGQPANGMVIDPEYIQKHVFIPFRADRLDLRGSGQRNTEAMVLTEASCLTLRYPETHARIIGNLN
jgi:hypothetical protein